MKIRLQMIFLFTFKMIALCSICELWLVCGACTQLTWSLFPVSGLIYFFETGDGLVFTATYP